MRFRHDRMYSALDPARSSALIRPLFSMLHMGNEFASRLRWCFGDYFERTQERLTRKALAEKINVTRAAVQQWLAGSTLNLKSDNYAALAKVFQVSRDWLEYGRGTARPATDADLHSMLLEESALVVLLAWEHAEELPPGNFIAIPRMVVSRGAPPSRQEPEFEFVKDRPRICDADWIRKMKLKPNALRVMYAEGDSMEPRIYEGDALVVDLSQRALVDGTVYALQYDEGERVKRLSRRPGGGLIIASDNPDYPTISLNGAEANEVRVIGRVVSTSGHKGL